MSQPAWNALSSQKLDVSGSMDSYACQDATGTQHVNKVCSQADQQTRQAVDGFVAAQHCRMLHTSFSFSTSEKAIVPKMLLLPALRLSPASDGAPSNSAVPPLRAL